MRKVKLESVVEVFPRLVFTHTLRGDADLKTLSDIPIAFFYGYGIKVANHRVILEQP